MSCAHTLTWLNPVVAMLRENTAVPPLSAFRADVDAAVPPRAVVAEPEQLRTYECDGRTGHRALPALAADGFYYAPDPSSQVVCTIGGNVAENSGGAHCLKYGFTANHVTGLLLVLPDGELVRLGGKGFDTPGPDLLGAFVGSEGTLG